MRNSFVTFQKSTAFVSTGYRGAKKAQVGIGLFEIRRKPTAKLQQGSAGQHIALAVRDYRSKDFS
jgi:hypothetical protein